ncbi:winged helix-turn-helix transcriptional regulator [Streptomyces sp. CA-249302]|uniref:winged helix-turn-helix transcriptional regulator n=1 Tax=Streptomyces sp. CA-249302 TaxID=3240058 RepID=UPI003D948C2A
MPRRKPASARTLLRAPRRSGDEIYGPGTPIKEALERLADRWTVLVVHALRPRPLRFNEIKARLGVSGQGLSRVLRDLERDGMVDRRVFDEVPVRVEYSVTPVAATMREVLHVVRDWAERTAPAIDAARRTYDARSAAPGATDRVRPEGRPYADAAEPDPRL